MDNLELLKYSIKNPEDFLDENYMFIDKNPDLEKYIERTKKIKNILITVKELKKKKTAEIIIRDFYLDLIKELNEYSNCSEFVCFVNACDTVLEDIASDLDLLEYITNLYLENRDLNAIVPSEWIQAILDKGSSKKKSKCGEIKLINLLEKKNYKRVDNLEDFLKNRKCVAQWSSKGWFNNKNIKKEFGANFGNKTQGKSLDLIIKNGKGIYFLEAKHMNTGGGGQNKQVLELIDIIKKKPSSNNHYISFLDGVFFNKLFVELKVKEGDSKKDKKVKNKIIKQQEDVHNSLKKNKNNYFINTAGFKKLF